MDIVDKVTRSSMMSGIKGKDTYLEILVRKSLHARGFRYQLHRKDIPGKPDMVFPKHNALIFIHGCFWHMHDCHLFKWPATRTDFWKDKFGRNRTRDRENVLKCQSLGWKVLIIWECALKGRTRRPLSEVIHTTANWLLYDDQSAEITGKM